MTDYYNNNKNSKNSSQKMWGTKSMSAWNVDDEEPEDILYPAMKNSKNKTSSFDDAESEKSKSKNDSGKHSKPDFRSGEADDDWGLKLSKPNEKHPDKMSEIAEILYKYPLDDKSKNQNMPDNDKKSFEDRQDTGMKIREQNLDDDGVMTGSAAWMQKNDNLQNKRNVYIPKISYNRNENLKYNLKKIGIENINHESVKKYAKDNYGDCTAEFLHMANTSSYMNTDFAKQHKIYNNYKEVDADSVEYFKNKLKTALETDDIDNIKGIKLDEHSPMSKGLSNVLMEHQSFKEILTKNRKLLEIGKSVNDTIELKDKNYHYGIGKCDLRNIHINKNGDIELSVGDIYDFPKDSKNELNRIGRELQDAKKLTPYFIDMKVVIPKNQKVSDTEYKK